MGEEKLRYWSVSESGDIDTTEEMGFSYPIPANRLTELNWLSHIFNKVFENDGEVKSEFYDAYLRALRNAGIKSIIMSTDGESVRIGE